MGWMYAPHKKQKHQVVLEFDGPVGNQTWRQYRGLVKAIAKAFDVKVTVRGRLRKVKGQWVRVPRPKRQKR